MGKYFNHSILFLLLGVFLNSCQQLESQGGSLPSSSGKYGEVLVVVDSSYENGAVGLALNAIFNSSMEGTPQKEASFRMATVDPGSFKSILKRSRNLFKISIEERNANKVKVDKNVWAKDQLLISVYADSEESAMRILKKNTQTIRDYYNEEELTRLKKQFGIKPNKELMSELVERYQIELLVPPAFMMMENDSNSFWIKKEKRIGEHQIIQGILYYSFPYEVDSIFTQNFMMDQRDRYTEIMITGSRDSSYMQVYREYLPNTKEVNFNGMYAKEYRGLWNMKNDFMGGPFLHYTFVDEKRQRVINLDAFVFAPKFNKREYLRELEAIIKSVKISAN